MMASQDEFIQRKYRQVIMEKRNPVMIRFYDCTPVRVAFGRLEHLLAPVARYAIWNEASDNYDMVNATEFNKRFPGYHVRKGILELLAQGLHVSWCTGRAL